MHPDRLGRFEILEVLGEGGSSVVYAARDGDQIVALKVLHPEAGAEAKDIDRFLDEAERMRRVSHPNLVPVLGAGLLPDGRPFITMPRLSGRSLAERIAGAPIDPPRAIPLFLGLAAGVAAVHDAGLIHRDIKPENVLWADDDRLVLLDLGIARDTAAAPSTTTQAGLARGTPAYMAPERFFGKPASVRSDVYELALVLFMMLVGRLPWDADDPRGRLAPKHPLELGARLPAPLSAALLHALSVDFEARPATVRRLTASILRAAADPGDPVPTGDASPRAGVLDPSTTDTHLLVTPRGPTASPRDAAYGPHAHAPTEMQPVSPAGLVHPTAPSPGAPPFPSAPNTPVVEIHAVGGSRPPRPYASAYPPPTEPKRSSPAGLLAMGAAIALVGAVAGAIATGSLRLGGEPERSSRARDLDAPAPSGSERPAASPGPRDVFSSEPAPLPPPASAQPSASGTSPPPSASSGRAQIPSATAPTPSASAGRPSPSASASTSSGPTPPACTELVALMCSPTSGARPEECTAWKGNVARWEGHASPDVVADTCQSALNASKPGLANRKTFKP